MPSLAASIITSGTFAETRGGTNQSTYALGDVLYASAANTLSKLAGNTTGTKKFLRQTGTGSVSAAPAWDTLVSGDLPTPINSGFVGYSSGTLAATGTDQAGAAALTNDNTKITTSAMAVGVRLPAASAANRIVVYNSGPTLAATVYPASGESIGVGSANAGVSVSNGAGMLFVSFGGAIWKFVTLT